MNSGVTVMLKKQCEHLVDQIKMEYSMNEGGSSLESLIEFCSKNGIEGYLSKEFHLPPITKEAEEIYQPFIEYFNKRKFGSEMPVLTILSYLPPSDRCSILMILLNEDSTNVEIYNKLSMALIKDGKYGDAITLLSDAKDENYLSSYNHNILLEKIEHLLQSQGSNFGSSISYEQTIQLVEQGKPTLKNIGMFEVCSEFNQIVIDFCNSKLR
jgi:hypothetical protein